MSSNAEFGGISFDLPKNKSNVIKVIGVGGGGSNAINHMFESGINGVDFIVCNTDSQALENSAVPNKIQLGMSLTEGLGAGANPEVGEQSAIESFEDIKAMLGTNTKMIFITAGMGGGTGTGAAPVIARMAKELGVLTVGIVTVPFQFEGKMRNEQAQIGVEKLRKEVDSLIVINNNKLREVYGNLGFKAGFAKADEVLATAAKGIAEVITHHYMQNIDLRDAKTVLSNSGSAIMGSATASGANRATDAISNALDSPLLNDNKITGAKNVLLLIISGAEEITIDEIGEINEHIQSEAGNGVNIIMGVGEDESIGGDVSVTIIATGFDADQQDDIVNTEAKKIIHALEENQKATQVLSTKNVISDIQLPKAIVVPVKKVEPVIKHTLFDNEVIEEVEQNEVFSDLIPTSELIKNINVVYDEVVAPSILTTDEFVITDINEIEEIAPEIVVEEKVEEVFSFETPIATSEELFEPVVQVEDKVVFQLSEEISEIEVTDHVEVVPVQEQNENGVIRYSLDYTDSEEILPVQEKKVVEERIEEESLSFEITSEVENKEVIEDSVVADAVELDPFNTSIEESLRLRADARRKKLKEFNYKFRNNANAKNVDEIEKEPAYKRMGIDLNEASGANGMSRTTIGTDSNDDIQLRSNNSFLHDNVD
ncbi:MAG: cell division protein FtsZ [Flavobacteriaceae bacterium]|nr:cell division protein FtsZ [Flavobacteriaceae bacterium]